LQIIVGGSAFIYIATGRIARRRTCRSARARPGESAGLSGEAFSGISEEEKDMQKPRLIYYNDGHHFHVKRIEPPASIHMLQWPVDEVAGTGVDLLVQGLGYGDVYFHDSKVGRVVG